MTATGRRDPVRGDARRNRRKLLDAAGALLRSAPDSVTIVAVARAAGLSPATAYRHFPSLDDLRGAYLLDVVEALGEFSAARAERGPALFDVVVREWGRLVARHGGAMVQLRSRRGFLERLRDHDPVIVAVRDAWERPLRELMASHDTPPESFFPALMLCNMIFDPREILDLVGDGAPMEAVLGLLSTAYDAALRSLEGRLSVESPRVPTAKTRGAEAGVEL
jgi:AcrR family transcriptional regulator